MLLALYHVRTAFAARSLWMEDLRSPTTHWPHSVPLYLGFSEFGTHIPPGDRPITPLKPGSESSPRDHRQLQFRELGQTFPLRCLSNGGIPRRSIPDRELLAKISFAERRARATLHGVGISRFIRQI